MNWQSNTSEKMGKYSNQYLKKTKARVPHQCNNCKATISIGEYYYKETVADQFLQSLHAKEFCAKCYEEHRETLLTMNAKDKNNEDKSLNGYF
jgi:hypothetical protein